MVGSDGKRVIPFQDIGNEVLKTMLEHDSLSFMLDGKPRSMITWYPYPKERPDRSGYFLVAYRSRLDNEREDVHSVRYSVLDSSFCSYDPYIYAWAELPKPYEEGE